MEATLGIQGAVLGFKPEEDEPKETPNVCMEVAGVESMNLGIDPQKATETGK